MPRTPRRHPTPPHGRVPHARRGAGVGLALAASLTACSTGSPPPAATAPTSPGTSATASDPGGPPNPTSPPNPATPATPAAPTPSPATTPLPGIPLFDRSGQGTGGVVGPVDRRSPLAVRVTCSAGSVRVRLPPQIDTTSTCASAADVLRYDTVGEALKGTLSVTFTRPQAWRVEVSTG